MGRCQSTTKTRVMYNSDSGPLIMRLITKRRKIGSKFCAPVIPKSTQCVIAVPNHKLARTLYM